MSFCSYIVRNNVNLVQILQKELITFSNPMAQYLQIQIQVGRKKNLQKFSYLHNDILHLFPHDNV